MQNNFLKKSIFKYLTFDIYKLQHFNRNKLIDNLEEFDYTFKCTFFNDDQTRYVRKYFYVQPNTNNITHYLIQQTTKKP